jgi:hypothetical protein
MLMKKTPCAVPRSWRGNHREKRARDGRQGARFAGAERESNRDERGEANRRAREYRERGPPADDPREHPARADAIGPPARRNLEQRVRDVERAEDIAHLGRAEAQIAGYEGSGHRDRDTVEIQNRPEHHRHPQHFVADASLSFSGRARVVHRGWPEE